MPLARGVPTLFWCSATSSLVMPWLVFSALALAGSALTVKVAAYTEHACVILTHLHGQPHRCAVQCMRRRFTGAPYYACKQTEEVHSK